MRFQDLLAPRAEGLYCPPGDFYIDPVRPVPRALITHAHSDHARPGHGAVLADQDRPNIFTVSVGNLLPGQEATVCLEYVTELEQHGRDVRLMLPTTIAPRYVPPPLLATPSTRAPRTSSRTTTAASRS